MTTLRSAPVPPDVVEDPVRLLEAWERALDRTGLSPNTKRTYRGEVRHFVTWLTDVQEMHRLEEVFSDPDTRTYAVRDYRRWLLTERKRAPKGVDTAMTAIGNVYEWVGLGAPVIAAAASRVRHAPRCLNQQERVKVLRAAEKRGVRDLALVTIAIGTGLRVSEIAGLNLDDVWISARKGEVQVRAGKGDRPRTVEMNGQTRDAVARWLAVRPQAGEALFLSRTGERMAVRTIRHAVDQVGVACGVDLSPHVLRHTYGDLLARDPKVDLTTIADLMGHSSVETTRIYTRPSKDVRAAAAESAHIDY